MIKKLYYKYDPNNGEPYIIDDNYDNLKIMIEEESKNIKYQGDEQDVQLSVTFVWMTERQFKNLPEAY